MRATRWLSALLLVTLILSSAPATVSAAPAAAPTADPPKPAENAMPAPVEPPPLAKDLAPPENK